MAKSRLITEYRKYDLDPGFPVKLLLDGEPWEISDTPNERLHFHDCLEIGICLKGSGYMKLRGEELPFQEGDVTVIPENIPHTTCSEPGTSSYWNYLMFNPWGFFKGILSIINKDYNLTSLPLEHFRFILSSDSFSEVYRLSLSIVKELKEKQIGYDVGAKGLLLALYIEIYRAEYTAAVVMPSAGEAAPPASKNPAPANESRNAVPSPDNRLVIAPALDYIFQNYMQQFSMQYLAELCHMSDTHFRRTFRQIMNISPLDYLHNTRITRACSLLGSTQLSILEISEQVGYHTLSSFNRHFQQIMGTTPSNYRRDFTLQENNGQENTIIEYSGWLEPQV
ncbi:MAG: AraC family transcriptional regulator [Lachnospiraceae bacterium]|nr:AraC family transcriptional regulator [Lachnospiraceae bacterium]